MVVSSSGIGRIQLVVTSGAYRLILILFEACWDTTGFVSFCSLALSSFPGPSGWGGTTSCAGLPQAIVALILSGLSHVP